MNPAQGCGKVYLVGAGPGAVDLLTVRAARLLQAADIVFFDALVDPAILALAPDARHVAVGKRCGRHSTAQLFINKRLIEAARRYATVVRLKGGDPMLFGRAQEEIDALGLAGIDVEVVPGITAAVAASAALKVSLTRRGVSRNVAFVTPRVGESEKPTDWIAAAAAADTAVVYMGAQEAAQFARSLMARGIPRDMPAAIVENASLPSERCHVGTLADLHLLAEQVGDGAALIVIGRVLKEKSAQSKRTETRARVRKLS